MHEIILHHYPLSPFSEKVRLALGLKHLAWRSVIVPVAMPKPDLMPLTGGYRRTPVMQVGADIYCDTQLILRAIERMHPEPSLFPSGKEGEATALAWWAEKSLFAPAVGIVANVRSEMFTPEFVAERRPFGFELAKEAVAPQLARYVQQLAAHLGWLGEMLADGRPFLLGDAPSAADLAAYHPIWFARKNGGAEAEAMLPLDPLRAWYDRIGAISHGAPNDMTAEEALAVAMHAEPAAPDIAADKDPSGLKRGSRITVTPDDTGRDPVHGRLLAADAQEIVIRRSDPHVGEVNVHFPRAGIDAVAA